MEELRDIHRLEATSLTDQIDKLKGRLEEAAKFLNASQSSTTQVEHASATRKAEIDHLQDELDEATSHAKEEEEKLKGMTPKEREEYRRLATRLTGSVFCCGETVLCIDMLQAANCSSATGIWQLTMTIWLRRVPIPLI